jgi:hypothetical protein
VTPLVESEVAFEICCAVRLKLKVTAEVCMPYCQRRQGLHTAEIWEGYRCVCPVDEAESGADFAALSRCVYSGGGACLRTSALPLAQVGPHVLSSVVARTGSACGTHRNLRTIRY